MKPWPTFRLSAFECSYKLEFSFLFTFFSAQLVFYVYLYGQLPFLACESDSELNFAVTIDISNFKISVIILNI